MTSRKDSFEQLLAMNTPRLAFVDESGSPSPAGGGRFLAVAVLVLESSRAIELHVRRARRSLHRRSPSSELKAAQADESMIRRFLRALADEPGEIYGAILDKRRLVPAGAEAAYRSTVAEAVALAAARHPNLRITIDRRYTQSHQRLQLELTIREAIAALPHQLVIIEQTDSTADPGLQAADFVAWALRRQAEGDDEWASLLQAHIMQVKTPTPR